jgi:hypothetical protein
VIISIFRAVPAPIPLAWIGAAPMSAGFRCFGQAGLIAIRRPRFVSVLVYPRHELLVFTLTCCLHCRTNHVGCCLCCRARRILTSHVGCHFAVAGYASFLTFRHSLNGCADDGGGEDDGLMLNCWFPGYR